MQEDEVVDFPVDEKLLKMSCLKCMVNQFFIKANLVVGVPLVCPRCGEPLLDPDVAEQKLIEEYHERNQHQLP